MQERHTGETKMSKYDFRPDSVNLIPSLPLFVAIGCISLSSSATLGLAHGFVDRIACCCFTILVSNVWYLVLTGLQCLNFQLQCLYHKTRRRGRLEQQQKTREALIDDRLLPESNSDNAFIPGQYTLTTLLVNTVEFRYTPREVRLFVSRKELWYTLYPMAFAVFVLFYCIPMYDISCTVSFITGLLSKSTYDEVKRGKLWKRGTGRQVCFALATMCGVVCLSGLFVLGIIVNRQAASVHSFANSSATQLARAPTSNVSVHAQTISENMLGTLLHNDISGRVPGANRRAQANSTNASVAVSSGNMSQQQLQQAGHGQTVSEATSSDAVSDDFAATFTAAYKTSMQSPNIMQMIMLYAICSYVPFFLDRTPDSIRLPVLLEIVQPSVSCIAAVTLFVASAFSHSHSDFVRNGFMHSSGLVAYVCLIPIVVWCCIYFVIKAARTKTTSYVCGIFILVVYIKILHTTSTFPVKKHAVQQVSIFVGCICALYIVLMTIFIRMENKCIQMGWDSRQDDEEDDDDMSFDGAGVNLNDTRQVLPRYCIEDVLQRVTQDIKTTEYILSHQNTPAAHAARNTRSHVVTAAASCHNNHDVAPQVQPESPSPTCPPQNTDTGTGLSPIHEAPEHDRTESQDLFEGDVENVALLSSRHVDIPNTPRT